MSAGVLNIGPPPILPVSLPPVMESKEAADLTAPALAEPTPTPGVEFANFGLTSLIHRTAIQRTQLAEHSVRADIHRLQQANQQRELLQEVLDHIQSIQSADGTIHCAKIDRALFAKLKENFDDYLSIPGVATVEKFDSVLKVAEAKAFLNDLTLKEKSAGTLSTTSQMELSNNMRQLQTVVEFFLTMIFRAYDVIRKVIEMMGRG